MKYTLTKKQVARMAKDMLAGVYHPSGYPKYSPLLHRRFREISKIVKPLADMAEKLYG